MITAPPPPPAIEQPASNQVSFGVVSGTAAAGTKRVIVRAGSRVVADRPLWQRHFQLRVALPTGESTVQVVTVSAAGRRSTASIPHVIGASTALPRPHAPRNDPLLAREVYKLVRSFGGTSAVYVENLATGAGASWNARATFPAASSLKLGIAVTALARSQWTPPAGSTLDRLLRQMLTYSDNAAANATERYFGGSTSGGSALVNSMMRSIGLVDTEMYGGYALDSFRASSRALSGPVPLRVDSQPSWGYGKKTSAYDLAALLRAVWLAGSGKGPLRTAQPGFTATDARYLLYLLVHVRDPGKLDREVGLVPGVRVLHKAGWINDARHDNGIVFWRGGAYIVTVMTYRGAGVGTSSDVLAGRVASAALRRFRG
ncbi:MAG: class A beta-lactamase-related serine hydrolase [Thermoleophilia bacterium]|nr:class A beta-lactamase-related serine hydrolase [Thermoleophilia bacterium]